MKENVKKQWAESNNIIIKITSQERLFKTTDRSENRVE